MAKKKKEIDITQTQYYKYAEGVINGDIVAGELVKLACKRFMNDLKRDDLEFKADIVDRFISFCSIIQVSQVC